MPGIGTLAEPGIQHGMLYLCISTQIPGMHALEIARIHIQASLKQQLQLFRPPDVVQA